MAKAKINPVILCVDDDQTVLQALRSVLEKTLGGQAEIEVAECGQDALDICEDLAEDGRPVSIVISDYIMPNMRGDELLIKLHEFSPKMIKIMLTCQSDLTGVRRVINTIEELTLMNQSLQRELAHLKSLLETAGARAG